MANSRVLDEGLAQLRAKNYPAALHNFKSLVGTKEEYLVAVAQYNVGDTELALQTFAKLYKNYPDNSELLYNYGVTLIATNNYDRAINCFKRAVTLAPAHIEARYNLAYLEMLTKQDSALNTLHRVLELDPSHKDAHYMRAQLLMAKGQIAKGLKDLTYKTVPHRISMPEWDGKQVAGSKVFVYGDDQVEFVQFIRYALILSKRNLHIVCEPPSSLFSLFKLLESSTFKVVKKGENIPTGFQQAAINALPHLFNPELDTTPKFVPYITEPDKKDVSPECQLAESVKLQVGLLWDDRVKPESFSELLAIEWIEWSLLATKLAVTDLELLKKQQSEYLNFGVKIKQYTELVSVLSNLDLVITVDNIVAHIAGAFGKEVWLLLPEDADWHWMNDSEKSSWYPSVTIFRESKTNTSQEIVAGFYTRFIGEKHKASLTPL